MTQRISTLQLLQDQGDKTTLMYTDFEVHKRDIKYHNKYHKWWLKCRLRALKLNYQTTEGSKECAFCPGITESLEHFLFQCTNSHHIKFYMIPFVQNMGSCIRWLFSIDRGPLQRSQISCIIEQKWKIRQQLLAVRSVLPPP